MSRSDSLGFLPILAVLLVVLSTKAQTLKNGGFEETVDGQASSWRPYRSYHCEVERVKSGSGAIRCESNHPRAVSGVMQEIVYHKPDKTPVVFGGWSRAEEVAANEYCIYLDIWYEGGGNAWGVTADWSQGSHDWEYAAEVFYPSKPIQKIQYFVFLRYGAGRVFFDDLSLERRHPELDIKKTRMFSDFPFTATGGRIMVTFWKKAEWQCWLTGKDGRVTERFSGNGSEAEIAFKDGVGKLLCVSAKAGQERLEKKVQAPDFRAMYRNPVKSGGVVWTADSMRCVTPLTYPTEKETKSAEVALELARNESESAQILITASDAGALSNVTVELSELREARGKPLDGCVVWQRVGYIRRQRDCYPHPAGIRADESWLPDPLLPPAPFSVRAGATQGIWLTARAAKGARPGLYKCEAAVRVGNALLKSVPITVRVRKFSNPVRFGLPTAFCVMDGFTKAQYPQRFQEMKRKTHDLMLDYRLNPDDISRTEPPEIKELLYARQRGMNRFNILNLVPKPTRPGKWVCYSPLSAYTPAFYEELKKRLTPYVARLREHGLEKHAYLYGFDERQHDYYPAIGELWRKLKADFPDIPVMTTAMMYKDMRDGKNYPEQNITDWFCPLSSVYDPELSAKLRAQGRQVWWYVCCGPTYPYANFASFEYPPIEGRVLGWQSYHYRSDGLLFWHVNLWPDKAPLKTDDTFLDAWVAQSTHRMAGDGQLLYPGVDEVMPSIRLANVRDGIEDYEWLMMLEKKAGRDAAEAVSGKISRSMTDFERSPVALRKMRSQLADMLERP